MNSRSSQHSRKVNGLKRPQKPRQDLSVSSKESIDGTAHLKKMPQNPTVQTVKLDVGFDDNSTSPSKPVQKLSLDSKPNVKLGASSQSKIKALVSPKTSTHKLFQLMKMQAKPNKLQTSALVQPKQLSSTVMFSKVQKPGAGVGSHKKSMSHTQGFLTLSTKQHASLMLPAQDPSKKKHSLPKV